MQVRGIILGIIIAIQLKECTPAHHVFTWSRVFTTSMGCVMIEARLADAAEQQPSIQGDKSSEELQEGCTDLEGKFFFAEAPLQQSCITITWTRMTVISIPLGIMQAQCIPGGVAQDNTYGVQRQAVENSAADRSIVFCSAW